MRARVVTSLILMAVSLYGGVNEDNDIDLMFMREDVPKAPTGKTTDLLLSNSGTQEPISATNQSTSNGQYQNNYSPYEQTSNYFVEAGRYYNVDPRLLWCVAKVESNMNPTAINKNTNGTYDIGLMQINTIHLPTLAKFGITKEKLLDPRTSASVGAWVMKGCIAKHGMTKNGITCYNGRIKNNPYADKVLKVFYQQEAKYASR